MPHYYVHPKTRPYREDDPDFPDRASAHAHLMPEHVVTFQPAIGEHSKYLSRELRRAIAQRVPWFHIPHNDTTVGHYAYLSTEHPGYVGYTKDLESGILDKRMRMRPGRYLTLYLPEHHAQHAKWIAACSVERSTLQIARTAADICAVYAGGPGSCMAGGLAGPKAEEYGWDHCAVPPVSVYGDSDLGIAYYGALEHASARCVVWPNKQRYGRIYGETMVLQALLEQAGYHPGSMDGARIRKIECCYGYLLPFLDNVSGVSSFDYTWLLICEDNADYRGDGVKGCTDPPEKPSQTCDHCGQSFDEEDECYCPSCRDEMFCCDRCEGHAWGEQFSTYIHTLCESCEEASRVECANPDCSGSYYEIDRPSHVAREMHKTGTDTLCLDCVETHTRCAECDEIYLQSDVICPACDRVPRCDKTPDLLAPLTTDEDTSCPF